MCSLRPGRRGRDDTVSHFASQHSGSGNGCQVSSIFHGASLGFTRPGEESMMVMFSQSGSQSGTRLRRWA